MKKISFLRDVKRSSSHVHSCKALKTIRRRWFTGAFGKWHGLVLRRGPNSPRPFNLSQIYRSRIRSWRSRSRVPGIDSSTPVDYESSPTFPTLRVCANKIDLSLQISRGSTKAHGIASPPPWTREIISILVHKYPSTSDLKCRPSQRRNKDIMDRLRRKHMGIRDVTREFNNIVVRTSFREILKSLDLLRST